MKKTLVIGASTDPSRYAYLAIQRLAAAGHPVLGIGKSEGKVANVVIHNQKVPFEDVDTVTMYIHPRHQPEYYSYIVSLKPQRVIFNPGTENPEFFEILKQHGIAVEVACTLVLLATNQYESQKGKEPVDGQ